MTQALIGTFVRDVDGKHWLVCYVLHKCVSGERLLICFRDGKRKTFAASSVAGCG